MKHLLSTEDLSRALGYLRDQISQPATANGEEQPQAASG